MSTDRNTEVLIPDGADNRITEVVVLAGQAFVRRRAKVKVGKGLQRLRLQLTATRVDRDSVQAVVLGSGEVYGVQYREVPRQDPPQADLRELTEKIRELKRRRAGLNAEKEVLNKQALFIDSVVSFAGVKVPEDIKTALPEPGGLRQLCEFVGQAGSELAGRRLDADRRGEDLDRELAVLERELAGRKAPPTGEDKVVEVVFSSAAEQEVAVEATYVVPGANWLPLYKADVPLDMSGVTLSMFAKITQLTGEDWSDVRLSVSNVVPMKGVALPEPASWTLSLAERFRAGAVRRSVAPAAPGAPIAMPSIADNDDGSAKVECAVACEMAAPSPPATVVAAEQVETPLAFEYQLPQPLSLKSREEETILPLFSRPVKGEFYNYAAPRVNQLAFLVCEAAPDREILSGELTVYYGGRFVGSSLLAEKHPGEAFVFSLGADRAVRLDRQKLKDKVKETFFGKIERGTVVRELAFKIAAENLKDRPVKLRLAESVPVSRTDRVEVKDLSLSPEPKAKNWKDREGVMLWELQLKPKESRSVEIGFLVTHPREETVVGL